MVPLWPKICNGTCSFKGFLHANKLQIQEEENNESYSLQWTSITKSKECSAEIVRALLLSEAKL